ncbi:uncharacterized protein M421DRAFT_345596 [Didymella exigua CBS 183.55]|uniref:Uncharacterized protein n=1 Tax=Didymella exigua CBS 183.55 TaxID=1150837 RepID=A0A6A5RYI0_9PLEO|nr:uncharacterized protein M421DRAFT_345596 [Didymella exigua CBS 183.55]KAF1931356.1 hypothetical protein M421DRAFT_345596 [Didymella exigua CBS 183.55]
MSTSFRLPPHNTHPQFPRDENSSRTSAKPTSTALPSSRNRRGTRSAANKPSLQSQQQLNSSHVDELPPPRTRLRNIKQSKPKRPQAANEAISSQPKAEPVRTRRHFPAHAALPERRNGEGTNNATSSGWHHARIPRL